MSGFLSEKFLRYARHLDATTIEEDTPCPKCGYNLRGLPRGRSCPECGGETTAAALRRPLVDAMLSGREEERAAWRLGFTLAWLVIAGVILGRIAMFAMIFPGITDNMMKLYFAWGVALGVLWIVAMWKTLPRRLLKLWPWMKLPRAYILLTQPLWLVAYGAWSLRVLGTAGAGTDALLLWVRIVCMVAAGTGLLTYTFLMHFIAQEAELEPAWQRLNLATWVLPAPTLLGLLFVGSMPWILVTLLLMVLVAWCWMLILLLLAIWQMRQHVAWAMRYGVESASRQQRMRTVREQIDAQVNSKIRDLPDLPDEDIPVPGLPSAKATEAQGKPPTPQPIKRGRSIWGTNR